MTALEMHEIAISGTLQINNVLHYTKHVYTRQFCAVFSVLLRGD